MYNLEVKKMMKKNPSEWKIIKRLKKVKGGGKTLKSFTLDAETCLILDSKPNASEYIRKLVKRDNEVRRILPDTMEDELYGECEAWLKRKQGERDKWGFLPLKRFPLWSQLTAKEVENMQKYMESELKQPAESSKIAKDALLWLQTHKGEAMEEMYERIRIQWYHEQEE